METRENIHQKLNNLFSTELANNLSAPLIKKVSCFNKGDFNNRFDLRVGKDESQLGNWWRHPIYIIAKPSAENVVINITIQPQRWPEDAENYANEHKNIIDQKYQEIKDLIKSHSINASDVKQEIKTESKFVLSYSLSVTIDKANPSEADYLKFIAFLTSLCQITVSLSDELPVGDDKSNDATIYNSNINEDDENLIYMGNTIINGIEIAESDFTDEMTYEDAIIACEKLGDGWRLPTIREAIEIFDKNPYLLGEFDNQKVYCTSSLSMGGEVWLHGHSEQKDAQFLESTYYSSRVRAVRTHDTNAAATAKNSYLIEIADALKGYIDSNKENNILTEYNEFFGNKLEGQFTWYEATEICNLLNDGWRLPRDGDEVEEACELIADLYGWYWTEETSEMYDEEPGKATGADIDNGYKGHNLYDKTNTGNIILMRDLNLENENDEEINSISNDFTITDLNSSLAVNTNSDGELPHNEIAIGHQVWSSKNLNVDKFRNGDAIPEAKTTEEWKKAYQKEQPAWCYYENNLDNGEKYGKLYNWYAVNDQKGLAPKGWHVPSDAEWKTLIDYLGGETVAGGKMKTKQDWISPNKAATNESGFLGLPGGDRSSSGKFTSIGEYGYWWSVTESGAPRAFYCILDCSDGSAIRYDNFKTYGYSVRCLKD